MNSTTIKIKMLPEEIQKFRIEEMRMDQKSFANFLGVTWQAVNLWESGEREMSQTTIRLIRLLKKYPQLVAEF